MEKRGDKFIFAGKSIGNHQTIAFSDTLVIKDLSDKTLLWRKTVRYIPIPEVMRHRPLRQHCLYNKKKQFLQKELIIAEVRSFVADGDTVCYWVR